MITSSTISDASRVIDWFSKIDAFGFSEDFATEGSAIPSASVVDFANVSFGLLDSLEISDLRRFRRDMNQNLPWQIICDSNTDQHCINPRIELKLGLAQNSTDLALERAPVNAKIIGLQEL